jgi:hypothetical protein
MSNVNFAKFTQAFPDWQEMFHVYGRDDSVTKRIVCTWNETGVADPKTADKTHQYHATINTATGDIFLDCRKRKIFAKHLTLLLLRPLHIAVKTLWHATIIGPLIKEIAAVVQGKQNVKSLAKNTFRSLCNIVRTPLYGLAMTISHLAGALFAVISPNSLYNSRELVGKLEDRLLGDEDRAWVLSPCFSPLRNIADLFDEKFSLENNKEEIEAQLVRFAKSQIEFRRENRALFNDTLMLLPQDKTYISPAAPPSAENKEQ